MFIMAHPEKVTKYVSYAQMHVNSPDLAKRRPRLKAFRQTPYISIPETGWKSRFSSITPAAVTDRSGSHGRRFRHGVYGDRA